MTQSSSGKNPYGIVSTASALFIYSLLLTDPNIIPSKFHNFGGPYLSKYAWEEEAKTVPYALSEEQEILHKAEIIMEFASKLLHNSVELEPEFAKVVTKKFWDLI